MASALHLTKKKLLQIELKEHNTEHIADTHQCKNPFFCHSTGTIPVFCRARFLATTLVAEDVRDPTAVKDDQQFSSGLMEF